MGHKGRRISKVLKDSCWRRNVPKGIKNQRGGMMAVYEGGSWLLEREQLSDGRGVNPSKINN